MGGNIMTDIWALLSNWELYAGIPYRGSISQSIKRRLWLQMTSPVQDGSAHTMNILALVWHNRSKWNSVAYPLFHSVVFSHWCTHTNLQCIFVSPAGTGASSWNVKAEKHAWRFPLRKIVHISTKAGDTEFVLTDADHCPCHFIRFRQAVL